jgi:hypothetical protein
VPRENLAMSEPASPLGLSEMAAICALSHDQPVLDRILDQEKRLDGLPRIRRPSAVVRLKKTTGVVAAPPGEQAWHWGSVPGATPPIDVTTIGVLLPVGRYTSIGIRTEGEKSDFSLKYETKL